VESVEYIYETELEMGIPKGLINQLNYTLKEGVQRPGDSFALWDMNLGDDTLYSIQALNVSTAQEDGKLDITKLRDFLGSIGDRLSLLRKDFNSIKDTFYNGLPPINKGKIEVTNRVASTEDTQDSAPRQRVIKETKTIGVVANDNSTERTSSVTPMSSSLATTEVVTELNTVIGDLERNRRITESMRR
jgi:hypothetical protein